MDMIPDKQLRPNEDLRIALRAAKLTIEDAAVANYVSERTLYRWLRKEMTTEQKESILKNTLTRRV